MVRDLRTFDQRLVFQIDMFLYCVLSPLILEQFGNVASYEPDTVVRIDGVPKAHSDVAKFKISYHHSTHFRVIARVSVGDMTIILNPSKNI